ncbi:MAG: hypothetical protein WKF48_12515 [Solirubrobacteraceae bacterium]
MSRTTLDIDPSVLQELRRRGERDGKSMGRVASELLARALVEDDSPTPSFHWVTHDLGTPLVDLEDKEALRAVLDGPR